MFDNKYTRPIIGCPYTDLRTQI